GGGDRLAGRGRMAEAVAAPGARVLRRLQLLVGLRLALEREVVLVLLLVGGLLDRGGAVRAAVLVPLVGGDQLGQHSGQRVHLVAAELGAGGEAGRPLGEDALEPEHERVAHLPLGRGRLPPGGHLGERVVEGVAEGGARREHDGRVVLGPQEGLARPGFGSEGRGLDAGWRLRPCRRIRERLVHACDTPGVPPLQVGSRTPSCANPRYTIADRAAAGQARGRTARAGARPRRGARQEPASPPKSANGLPGRVSQTSSPPGSTSPCRLRARRSAASRVAVPAITYEKRRTTP